MPRKKPSGLGFVLSVLISAILVGAGIWAYTHRQYITDQLVYWGYAPPAKVAALNESISFTPKGQFYFYVSQPSVETAAQFNQSCPQQEQGNPILGCYDGFRVVVYDIQNPELSGIKEVTAAHETLHAVWQRLSDGERRRLEDLIKAEYQKSNNPSLQERVDYYNRNEPGELYNELHSILGTEFTNLSPELENYYRHYFTDRSKIVAYHQNYDQVFTGLTSESESLYTDLTTLGAQIQIDSRRYEQSVSDLSQRISSFNDRANSGEFSSNQEFNRERSALVVQSDQLESQRAGLNSRIADYNVKYQRYQSLAVRIQELNSSIDSTSVLAPAPAFN